MFQKEINTRAITNIEITCLGFSWMYLFPQFLTQSEFHTNNFCNLAILLFQMNTVYKPNYRVAYMTDMKHNFFLPSVQNYQPVLLRVVYGTDTLQKENGKENPNYLGITEYGKID